MKDEYFIEKILQKHAEGLPGRPQHLKMAAYALRSNLMDAPPTARKAGVLMLLFPKQSEWHILLTERTTHQRTDRHSGQISFPGGQFEPSDLSMEKCALREAHEECGIEQNTIQVIGKMTDLYIPVSNFHVFPYLAWTDSPPQYKRQETEVKEIIEVPIRHLLQPENKKTRHIYINENLTLEDVPYFDINGKAVWGATAMMISELLAMV
jgi:8-oxo-dGTP pyrophosphatase MutT (NUDIX family)